VWQERHVLVDRSVAVPLPASRCKCDQLRRVTAKAAEITPNLTGVNLQIAADANRCLAQTRIREFNMTGRFMTGRFATAICAGLPLLNHRLINQSVDFLPIVPTDRTGRRREIHDDKFFLRVDPPVGAAGARP
jgi:hypothetical protein